MSETEGLIKQLLETRTTKAEKDAKAETDASGVQKDVTRAILSWK